MGTLILWDVDHTLIENGGVSKANYALAFEILIGRPPEHPAKTSGRTDVSIVAGILSDNGEDPTRFSIEEQLAALHRAGDENRHLLAERGHALPGAVEALTHFKADSTLINSVLTGNIEPNARTKLAAFDLDQYVDFTVGGFGAESAVRSDLVPVAQAKAAERYHFDSAEDVTVLIGDTHRDIDAGLDGGARVIAVATGGESVAELETAGAHVALPGLADLDALVAALAAVRQLGPAQPSSS
jgi:phosphoglycolate phosphatase-like HAD superfamily hydrolase